MKTIDRDFNHLYFHDGTIEQVVISSAAIRLLLDFAHVLAEHPDNRVPQNICTAKCVLVFTGVRQSISKAYIDETKSWSIVIGPTSGRIPKVISESSSSSDNNFQINGTAEDNSWCEWKIESSSFHFEWSEEQESWLTK